MSAPEARNSDGSNNNRDDPTLGTPGQRLKRLAGSDYEDGFSAIAGGRNARDISNQVFAQEGSTENQAGVSDLWTIWGQFIDHDLDLTPDASGEFVPIEGLTVPLQRSVFDPETGDDEPREQITVVTSFMDASMVYGSDAERMEALRCGEGGRLLTSEGNLLPVNASGLDNAGDRDPDNPLFVAGDVRANENTPLTTLHTLFVREHNYWADKIADENPQYTDEEVFQRARAIVEAEIQHVTYKEYLPILLGPDGLAPYQGYNPTVDPSISTEFSTAAFRFGHTMVSSIIQRLAENGDTIENGNLTVAEAFFNNDALKEDGPDVVLRGLAEGKAQELDTFVIDDLRNLLVSGAGDVGLDLTALNIERGRDHGIPKFLALRDAIEQTLGIDLPDINDFEDISSNPIIVERLRAAYGDVNEIDAWVGGLAEDAVDGALVGPTFFHILADQFTRTRDGDRFWYEERFKDNPELLAQIQNTSLSDIIKRTGEVEHLQDDAFIAHDRIGGTEAADTIIGSDENDLLIGFAGDDILEGLAGDDDLYGGDGNDELRGGDGDDVLNGGAGLDLLIGGDGADHFVVGISAEGIDQIADFVAGEDTIDFSALVDASDASLAWEELRTFTGRVEDGVSSLPDQVAEAVTSITDLSIDDLIIDQTG